MTKDTHTPAVPLRIPRDDWQRFEGTAGPRNRTAVVIEFIRWYNRDPGAKLPKRPDHD